MRFFNYLLFTCFFSLNVIAQQDHFAYLQTENKQPFYIKLNDRLYSSASSGYVLIPKLSAGIYNLNIGFPKNEWPVQIISINIKDNDEGFILKNFDEKGWGLFNIQTMDLVMGQSVNAPGTPLQVNKTDAFSNTLAEVSNTPSIRQVETIIPVAVNSVTVNPLDSLHTSSKEEGKTMSPVLTVPIKYIGQLASVLDNSGRSAIYAISEGDHTDTIRLFIPYDTAETNLMVKAAGIPGKEPEKADTIINNTSVPDTILRNEVPAFNTQNVKEENPAIIDTKPLITDVKLTDKEEAGKTAYKVTIINTDCKSMATNDDFLKMRKKMAAADNEEEMTAAAKKGFRSKCFTTEQVKNLSLLFLKDEGKYNFYDAAYRYVSDKENFKNLQSQLSEEYYLTRFKAMLR